MSEGIEALRAALVEAEEAASAVSEPYRVEAFKVAARQLLEIGRVTVQGSQEFAPRRPRNGGALQEHIGEILARLQGKSHQDLFEAIVFHALRARELDGLTKEEILEAYSVARVPKPANPSDVIAKCMRRGHLMPGDDRDGKPTIRMTVTGEVYVEKLLAAKAIDRQA